jgi:serine/threonine protein kinase
MQIVAGHRPPLPDAMHPAVRQLIADCWSGSPGKRPTFAGVLARLNDADFAVLPAVDPRAVRMYVAEIENLENACVSAEIPTALRNAEPPFNPEAWHRDFAQFALAPVAGGAFARVYKAEHPETHEVVALKRLNCRMAEADKRDLLHARDFREIMCLIRFNHPCILPLAGWSVRDGCLEIGTKWFERGSLDKVIEAYCRREEPAWFDETAIAVVVAGAALGMRHIHERGVIHRDFKPANILVDDAGRPLICDLGLSRDFALEMTVGVNIGTPAYSSPEVTNGTAYGPPCDVFAFGTILFELVMRRRAFTGSIGAVGDAITKKPPPPMPKTVTLVSRELIAGCWKKDPEQRLSFRDVVDDLKKAEFKVLPGVQTEKVMAYVAEIETKETRCYRAPVVLPELRKT